MRSGPSGLSWEIQKSRLLLIQYPILFKLDLLPMIATLTISSFSFFPPIFFLVTHLSTLLVIFYPWFLLGFGLLIFFTLNVVLKQLCNDN